MSDMRRAARGLVEAREERYATSHPEEVATKRLMAAFARLGPTGAVHFEHSWERDADDAPVLRVRFAPTARAQRLLQALSLGLVLLIAASAWALATGDAGAAGYLLPIIAVLAVLGMPFLVLALASQREADESRLRKAIRVALLDEAEGFPPAHRWDDED